MRLCYIIGITKNKRKGKIMKAEWSSTQYLKFENQRNQPAIDLMKKIVGFEPTMIADLGCGPGNSTMLLKKNFPDARIIGIDNSENMIQRAREQYKDLEFVREDIRSLTQQYDLLFSNACLQWVPEHQTLIPELITHLNGDGVFAVQFPMNNTEPLYQIIQDVASEECWNFRNVELDYNGTLTPDEYFDLLSASCSEFQIWETKYYHNLSNHEALLEWVKGTRIRPYLAHLDEDSKVAFEQKLLNRVKEAYQVMANGEVILHFNRFFMVGVR